MLMYSCYFAVVDTGSALALVGFTENTFPAAEGNVMSVEIFARLISTATNMFNAPIMIQYQTISGTATRGMCSTRLY